jgi:asparagine synthase (glutamine-hydrolysing)
MRDLLAELVIYGPDTQATWFSGSMALGHCLLRNTPESAFERQPLQSSDGRFCLVWDGRLDNRDEVRKGVSSRGIEPRDSTDPEFALASFLTWGTDCPKHLLGDFAFAVWDAVEQRLFIARDQVGARPLYWTANESFFAFASDDTALLSLPGVSREPYAFGVAQWFDPGLQLPEPSSDSNRHWYDAVRIVRAGQSVCVDSEGKRHLATYWEPSVSDEYPFQSDVECEEAFLDVFGAAVRARLRCDGDVAMLLSGGLDSAGVLAMSRRELFKHFPEKVFHAYSAIADESGSCIESRCILSMAEGFRHHFHALSVPSFSGVSSAEVLLQEVRNWSHPEDNDVLLQSLLFRAAGQLGHRAILHGSNGDLAMWSPARYVAYWLRAGQWRTAWDECREASHHHNFVRGTTPRRLAAANAWTAWAPSPLKSLVHAATKMHDSPFVSPLNRSFVEAHGWRRQSLKDLFRAKRPFHSFQQTHVEVLDALTNSRSAMPRIAGRSGVDCRDPWEDLRVLEFALRLPLRFRVRRGWTKYLVRSTFEGDLAPLVSWRVGKQHLGGHFTARVAREWLRSPGLPFCEPDHELWRYLDRDALRGSSQRATTQADGQALQLLYQAVTLFTWLDRIRRIGAGRRP